MGGSADAWGTIINTLIGDDATGLDTIIKALETASKTAAHITSGTFDVARIPNLAASKITSGELSVARGGTGRSSLTTGHIVVGAGTDALNAVAPGADGGFVRSNGTTWARGTIQASDVPNLAASKITSGTFDVARIPDLATSKITSGTFDVARIPDLAASKITSGTFAVARGGTGVASVASGNLLVGAGTSAMTALAPSTAGGFVRSNGSAWVRSTIQAGDLPNHSAALLTSGTLPTARLDTDVGKVVVSPGPATGSAVDGTVWYQAA